MVVDDCAGLRRRYIGIHFLVRGLVVANGENFTVRSSRSPTRALLLYIRYRGEQHIYGLYL